MAAALAEDRLDAACTHSEDMEFQAAEADAAQLPVMVGLPAWAVAWAAKTATVARVNWDFMMVEVVQK